MQATKHDMLDVRRQLEDLPAEALYAMLMQHIAQVEKLYDSSIEMDSMIQIELQRRGTTSEYSHRDKEEGRDRLDDGDIEILKSACVENEETL